MLRYRRYDLSVASCCSEGRTVKRRRRRWTDEELLEISKAYSGLGRSGFASGDPSAYNVSLKRGLLERMTWLGQRINPFRDPCYSLYKYSFPDGAVYVGITMRPDQRKWQHATQEDSAVFRHSKLTGASPVLTIVKSGLTREDARAEEGNLIDLLTRDGNVSVLNRAPAGAFSSATGSVIHKWTKMAIVEVAKMCRSRREMSLRYASAYQAAYRHGWLDDIPLPRFKSGWDTGLKTTNKSKWTLEDICSLAKTCRYPHDMAKSGNVGALKMLYKHPEWWDEVFPLFLVRKHLPQVKREIKESK